MTAEARELRAEVAALPDTADPRALSGLRARHPDADPGLLAALATQVRLARRGEARLGPWAREMVLEEEALQQATRRDVARYRATRLAERLGPAVATDTTVADIGCGLGVDARALAEAGFRVLAIEQDPWRAEAAEINLGHYAERAHVICGDALLVDSSRLHACGAAYVDPARRSMGAPRHLSSGRSPATTDPAEWSPPWPWVLSLAECMPVVAKAAPGMDQSRVPPPADIEWIDSVGETVEASIWLGPLGRGMRRATAVRKDEAESLDAPRATRPANGPSTAHVGPWLLEPGPAVVRARLVADLAVRLDAHRLDGGDWLTSDATAGTLLARAWRVVDEVPHAARDLRAWLRGHGSVTWKTTEARVSAADWDRRVGHRRGDGAPVTIVITGQGRAFAVERARD